MRTIRAKILLWFAGMGLLAVASFAGTAMLVAPRIDVKRFDAVRTLRFEGALDAFERGGAPALRDYLAHSAAIFPGQAYLTDARGVDLITGEDRSALIDAAAAEARPFPAEPLVLAMSSPDGRYRFLLQPALPPDLLSPLPYFAWIPLVIGLLCYLLAMHIAAPARQLRDVVDRFGHGDLSIRVRSARQDEFGDLARAFDAMADRVEDTVFEQHRLLRDVSHELRSPLARLRYAIDLARHAPTPDALDRIERDIHRLAALVDELLETSHTPRDIQSRFETLNLGALVAAIVDDALVEANARGAMITLTADETAHVRGVPPLLRRAIENVLRNAIRHTPRGTSVDVTITRTGATCDVTVRDHGSGVPEHELGNILEPFYRVEQDRDRATGGVGLGLAIAQHAVRLHEGQVTVANADPGLRVAIRLPAFAA
jgi:signal transduction histidine kinase